MWRRKTKLAIAALGPGDTDLALDVCTLENRPDPEQRTLFIDEFSRWEFDLKAVLAAVKNSDSPGLRSGICLAVGQVPIERIDADKESWKSVASEWFVEHGDTTTHSAAGWLLRQWRVPTPVVPDQEKLIAERNWFINTAGMTMLQMAPGTFQQEAKSNSEGADRVVEITQPYWVGDREVTRGQFEEFMNDTIYAATEKPAGWDGVDTLISPTPEHPAQQVSWYDAVMYCNCLSQREGLQPCYERTGTKEKGGNDETLYDAWRVIPGAPGYRLLHEAEWEYACRAGTTTEYSSGDDESLLMGYCQMHPSKLTSICGEKLPNAWGVYDAHGNAWEWCWQLYDESLNSNRVNRGGCWYYHGAYCSTASRYTSAPSDRTLINGFRLALSSPSAPSPEADK